MKRDFWNDRYAEKEFVYGTKANVFLSETLKGMEPGKILFPAEGEGRNAVYTAKLGWDVEAFDYSEEGKKKAMHLSDEHNVSIDYHIATYDSFLPHKSPFDVIGLIYNHTDSQTRKTFNRKLIDWLKPGAIVIMEQFSKRQLGLDSGGPKSEDYLMDIETVQAEFPSLSIDFLSEEKTILSEGAYHEGEAYVIRMLAHKL